MPEKFKIGLFTSGTGPTSRRLIKEVYNNVKTCLIPNSEIIFVFCSQEKGESENGDLMIETVRNLEIPLITFSSIKFQPKLRQKGKRAEKMGDISIINQWRLEYDEQISKLLLPTDLDVLLGYMWVMGQKMCQERTIINLHPTLPNGPKGTYWHVIWQLIEEKRAETGVMIHLVTKELDRGPTIVYCRFSIRGEKFDPLWLEIEKRFKKESFNEILKKEERTNTLFELIRENGVIREFPMVIFAIKILAERKIEIKNGKVIDICGNILESGYDLTKEIDALIKQKGED